MASELAGEEAIWGAKVLLNAENNTVTNLENGEDNGYLVGGDYRQVVRTFLFR